ncbi:hypothetical protein JIR23_21950 [Bradyrhizobium diazoefficiens]|nr:hypothetical protein [Bradyrhizobium diazoefficiens]QQN62248.1 hypothetical protein JIR23_21950 [Bradyrhizobium diazoefficiens]
MSIHERPIAMPARNVGPAGSRVNQAKAAVFETVQTLTETTREALFAYAMTGSAVASLAIIAAPHLEVLLRCVFHGRG